MKEAHKAQDIALIETSLEVLNTAWQAASQELYQAQQEAGTTENGADTTAEETQEGGSASEDVTDVEYEEVDDSNNK